VNLYFTANGHLLGQAKQLRWTLHPPVVLVAFCDGADVASSRPLIGKHVELEIVNPTTGERLQVNALLDELIEFGRGVNVHLRDFKNLRGAGLLKALFASTPPSKRTA
jgi:hypothetical protein